MGLFSGIVKSSVRGLYSGIFKKSATSASFLGAYRVASGRSYGGGGYGLDRFRSIIDAHSSIEDIVSEWELNDEMCEYQSLEGYDNCWTQAYEEEYERAEYLAMLISIENEFGDEPDPEDLMNWERVERDALKYAMQLAKAWYSGDEWIPEEIMDWAWYDLSDHNE